MSDKEVVQHFANKLLTKENKKMKEALTVLSNPKNFVNVCCDCSMDKVCRVDDDSYDTFVEIAERALK